MSELLPEKIAEMIEKRLCGEISPKYLSDWAWEAHWKDETEQSPYDEKNREAIWDVISALAQSDTEGFELETYELRELLRKLQVPEGWEGIFVLEKE